MPDEATEQQQPSKRERFQAELKARAERIKYVNNEVFTLKIWQLVLYFAVGLIACALMVVGMIFDGGIRLGTTLGAIAIIIVMFVAFMVMRAGKPMSFLQYTAIENGNRYTFRVIGKARAMFSDGAVVVESDRQVYRKYDELPNSEFKYDFFADMTVDMRIGKAETETFVGTLKVGDKTVKCKIMFKNGAPFRGVIGGARIKYFDVNSTKEKFVVPQDLRNAAKEFDVAWPKLGGLVIK